jgi:hypothetical protein
MNLPDLTTLGLTELWLQGAALALALLALLASWRLARRASRERRRIDGMHRDLQVFAEASTRVADTLDQMLRGAVEPAVASTSSRRFVLLKARERLEQGEALETVASRLDLCEDERRLLEFLQRSGTPAPRVHVA